MNPLLFGKLMMSDANVLILDEPTNHLDMKAIEPSTWPWSTTWVR